MSGDLIYIDLTAFRVYAYVGKYFHPVVMMLFFCSPVLLTSLPYQYPDQSLYEWFADYNPDHAEKFITFDTFCPFFIDRAKGQPNPTTAVWVNLPSLPPSNNKQT